MQQRTLIRGRTLAAFRDAIATRAVEGPAIAARRRAVVVPTRASAEMLRQTIEHRLRRAGSGAVLLPDMLTRDDLFGRMAAAQSSGRSLLSRTEREVLLDRAARRTARRPTLGGAPFELRPSLVAAILDFYDELMRRQRPVRRFARVLFDQLRAERGTDRGSERLITETAFLGLTFLAYERAVEASGGADEHTLRRALVRTPPDLPFDHLIIAVADHPSDPRGLWPADFDALGRLGGLSRLDVVMTDEAHDAGFRERLERELPGIEEVRWPSETSAPVLVRLPDAGDESPCVVSRDREEEVRAVARAIRRRAAEADGELREATAIVFHRPLPYLYLAQQVLTEARVPFQAFDALPLGAEPYAALLDLVMSAARTGGTREAAIALLRSRLMRFEVDGAAVTARDASALDAILVERRATGEAATYPVEVDAYAQRRDGARRELAGARRAAQAAADLHEALRPFRAGASASVQVAALSDALRRHERLPAADDAWRERHLRARAAVLGVLDELALAFVRHDDRARPHEDVTALIHHAIEGRTFTPRRGASGAHLVDAVAARFGDFDHVHLVGLVETDWPERTRRNIFYTSGLLQSLGWPQEPDELRAQQAAFRDLLTLPARTLTLHAFRLEGDGLVALSPMVESARDLPSIEWPGVAPAPRIFDDEVLTDDVDPPSGLEPEPEAWLALRRRRPDLLDPRYRGVVMPQPTQQYRVSRVDRYVDCPFKYFAESVLRLPEEREEAAGLTPLERGVLVHTLFERFYREWAIGPGGTITPATLPDAIAMFTRLTEDELARLPEADRALERTRLLGSIVARGVAERVFELESDAGDAVTRRLLEFPLKGTFSFPRLGGLTTCDIAISGKADRIDVFDDGSLRVVDYKLSRLPDLKTSIQIAVYAWAAAQLLQIEDSRPHPVRAAMYLAFGDDDRFEGALGGRGESADSVVTARASEFAGIIDRIERGEFPPRPRHVGDCQWCRYAGVCRKEYQGEDDEAAESV